MGAQVSTQRWLDSVSGARRGSTLGGRNTTTTNQRDGIPNRAGRFREDG